MKRFDISQFLGVLSECDVLNGDVVMDEGTSVDLLNLDSLLGAEILLEIEKRYNIEIPFSIFLEVRTIGDFISCINHIIEESE